MSSPSLLHLVARCRALCRPRSQATDMELLARFAQERDNVAFEELLERYAPLVWGICRRIARTESDREDAFQATFLALVRQAGRLDGRQPLGGWLHTVAVRVARKTAIRTAKQNVRDTLVEPVTSRDIADEVGSRELLRLVDEEIERLPANLRMPLVLCCLQGRTRDEAAEALGCSVAAVKSRLERGRNLLRRALLRRGVQLPAAFLVLGLTTVRVHAALWARTMQVALHRPTPEIAALAEAGVSASMMGKSKLLLATLLLLTSVAGAVGGLLREERVEAPSLPQVKPAEAAKKNEVSQVRRDRHGDLLPEGAIARLGTVRWRHGFLISALAYSPDGKMIAAIGAGRALTLWDATTGQEVRRFPNINQPNSMAYSPDGKMIATTDNPFCYLWDVSTGKEIRRLKGHTNVVRSVGFSPDNKQAATAGSDGTLRLWEIATGKELRRIDCGSSELCRLAYSPDGKWIASTNMEGEIRLWDPATGEERRQLKGHTKGIWWVVFSPDGKRLATSSNDGTIRLWDVATGLQSHVLAKDIGEGQPIAFSPDGTLLAAGDAGGTIRLWSVENGEEKRHWQADQMSIRTLAFSPDGKTLAVGMAIGSIRRWDVATGREQDASEGHLGFVNSLRFSADGTELTTIGRDRRVLWWDLSTSTPRRQFSWKAKGYCAAALSPDDKTLAAMGSWLDPDVRLWDVGLDKPSRLLGKLQKFPVAIAFSPDGRLVAAGGQDQTVHVWDVRQGKELRKFSGLATPVNCLSFSPDGKSLACGMWTWDANAGRAVYLWDVASGKELAKIDRREPCLGTPVAFSPDGKVLASGAGEGVLIKVHLWSTTTGKELCRHTGHRETVGTIAFSPDGKLVASGCGSLGTKDNSVHVWEAATGSLLRRFEGHHSCVSSLAFSPDGLTVASGAGDSTILLWDIPGRRSTARRQPTPLTPGQLDACWAALSHTDAAKAYDAVWSLTAAAEQAVPFLQRRLSPVAHPDMKTVARLIENLDSDDFRVRQKATEDLSRLGDVVTAALRKALAGKPTVEVRRRIEQILEQTRGWTPERLRDHRAIQVLEHIGTRKAKEVLQQLAGGAPQALRTEEAKAALERLTK